MGKTIYLVRHAEGKHNINHSSHIRDPEITVHGKDQCWKLKESFPFHDDVEVVMASPLRRTIQTAIYSFAPVLRKSAVQLVLVPQAQEISADPCDTGLEPEQLKSLLQIITDDEKVEFDSDRTDYSILAPGWNNKKGRYAATLKAVEQRAADLRCWLWKRPETSIVLVTHGAFMHYLTEDWTSFVPNHGTAYRNCEFRSFTFTESSNEYEAHLVEIGGSGKKALKPCGTHSRVITGVDS